MTRDAAHWNGKPCTARRVRVIVADASFPQYWARPLVGTARNAVEISDADQLGEQPFYIDDNDGEGWEKVTARRGSPAVPHRNLWIREVIEDRDQPVRAPAPDRDVQTT